MSKNILLKRPTSDKPLYTQVVEQIQELIKKGDLAPGDQLLPERELSETLGVSRTSVRQALAVLDGMRIIEITPRNGAFVRQRSLEGAVEPLAQILYQERAQVTHLFEVRHLIETQATALAAQRRDEADLAKLHRLNQAFETDLASGDLAYQANVDFHLAIVDMAKNPLLTEIFKTLLLASMDVYLSARHQSLSGKQNLAQFVHEHEQIIEAITQQTPELACQAITKHLDGARQRIESIMGRGN